MQLYVETSQDFAYKNWLLFQVQRKLKACRNSTQSLSSGCFNAGGGHVEIICLHILVFSGHDILYS